LRTRFAGIFLSLSVYIAKISGRDDPSYRNFPGTILPETLFTGFTRNQFAGNSFYRNFPKTFSGKPDENTNSV